MPSSQEGPFFLSAYCQFGTGALVARSVHPRCLASTCLAPTVRMNDGSSGAFTGVISGGGGAGADPNPVRIEAGGGVVHSGNAISSDEMTSADPVMRVVYVDMLHQVQSTYLPRGSPWETTAAAIGFLTGHHAGDLSFIHGPNMYHADDRDGPTGGMTHQRPLLVYMSPMGDHIGTPTREPIGKGMTHLLEGIVDDSWGTGNIGVGSGKGGMRHEGTIGVGAGKGGMRQEGNIGVGSEPITGPAAAASSSSGPSRSDIGKGLQTGTNMINGPCMGKGIGSG